MHAFSYSHLRDGVYSMALVADWSGTPVATWMAGPPSQVLTGTGPVDGETFRRLWNGIAAEEVFARHKVRTAAGLDPAGHHIGAWSWDGGRDVRAEFLVPSGEADPQFARWLEALDETLRGVLPGRSLLPADNVLPLL
jgi:hypothetical protein